MSEPRKLSRHWLFFAMVFAALLMLIVWLVFCYFMGWLDDTNPQWREPRVEKSVSLFTWYEHRRSSDVALPAIGDAATIEWWTNRTVSISRPGRETEWIE